MKKVENHHKKDIGNKQRVPPNDIKFIIMLIKIRKREKILISNNYGVENMDMRTKKGKKEKIGKRPAISDRITYASPQGIKPAKGERKRNRNWQVDRLNVDAVYDRGSSSIQK